MKIKKEHYDELKSALTPIMRKYPMKRYLDEGLSETRYLFDCLYAAKITTLICDKIYPYANDEHIKTALRNIQRESEQ